MIIDYINSSIRYDGLSEKIKRALSFLADTDLQNLKVGKHHIDGDDIFYIVDEYETKLAAEGMLEAHQKYIDIQTVVLGSEYIGYDLLLDQAILREYES